VTRAATSSRPRSATPPRLCRRRSQPGILFSNRRGPLAAGRETNHAVGRPKRLRRGNVR
jgi:hypothetical protein